MPRFFVSLEDVQGNLINITGNDAYHIKNVLRLRKGSIITVCSLNGIEYTCKIQELNKENVNVVIISEIKSSNEPNIKITLFQSLPKADKMELIIQKCVELGVHKIVPVYTNRTIVKLNSKSNKKIDRWNKVSTAAAKQSNRGIIPIIGDIVDFKTAVEESKKYDLSFMPYERENNNTIKNILKGFKEKNIAIFIGPEGGFSDEEAALAKKNNIETVTLGKRILRTETVGLVAISIIMYEKGEM